MLVQAIDPVLKPVEFRRAKRRYWRTAANGHTVVVDFHGYPLMPGGCSFMIEWGVVPSASMAWFRKDSPRRVPHPIWGCIAERVQTPVPMTTFGEDVMDVWAFWRDEGYDPCTAVLVPELRDKYLPLWRRLHDGDQILAYLKNEVSLETGLIVETPGFGLWGCLAVHVDDADPAVLDEMLSRLEQENVSHGDRFRGSGTWLSWWRQRLNMRIGAVGPSGS